MLGRNLQYKSACINEQHKKEDEEREQSRANWADIKEQEAEKDAWLGNGWIATLVSHSLSLMTIALLPRPLSTNIALPIPGTPLSAPPLERDTPFTSTSSCPP